MDLRSCRRTDIAARRGVYFFFDPAEARRGSGTGPRVVRVGTHGLGAGGKSTLWSRLAQHRGSPTCGNQRGSIFRRHIGAALMQAGRLPLVDGWWVGSSTTPEQRAIERETEAAVSATIGAMPFLWLGVDDDPGPNSLRGVVERNCIALLSSDAARLLDPPTTHWLGHHARAPEIRRSGLWNVRHIGEAPEQSFLDLLERLIGKAGA